MQAVGLLDISNSDRGNETMGRLVTAKDTKRIEFSQRENFYIFLLRMPNVPRIKGELLY